MEPPTSFVVSPQNWWVEQLNDLAAGGPLFSNTVHTTKIFYAAIGKMEKQGEQWQRVRITKKEITEAFPLYKTDRNFKPNMAQVAEHLTDAKVRLRFSKGDTKVVVAIIDCAYIDGAIQLTWHPDMKDLLVLMKAKGQFTSYQLKAISHLRTDAQFALFNYLRSMAYRKVIDVSMDLLRDITMCQDTYAVPTDFVRYVVTPSIKAINESSDITVTATRVFSGKVISGYNFRISVNRELEKNPSFRAMVSLLAGYGLLRSTASDIAAFKSAEEIIYRLAATLTRLEDPKNAREIRAPAAFIAAALRSDAPFDVHSPEAKKKSAHLHLKIAECTYLELTAGEQEQVKRSFVQILDPRVKADYIRFGNSTDATSEIRTKWRSWLVGALGTASFTPQSTLEAVAPHRISERGQVEFLPKSERKRETLEQARKRMAQTIDAESALEDMAGPAQKGASQ